MSADKMVAEAIESAVLGPNDVLVLNFQRHMTQQEFARILEAVSDGPLKGRILIVAGEAKMLVARNAAADR